MPIPEKIKAMSYPFLVGPVLGFRGCKAGRWYTSVLVVLPEEAGTPQVTVSESDEFLTAAKALLLKTYAGCNVWRLDWWVGQTDKEKLINYTFHSGASYRYLVPAQNQPLRICYGSCFGVHTLKDVNKVRNKNAMWKVMRQKHGEKPYHLFFLGGDQVYSDQVWENVPALRDWLN
ncbi:MAG: hypothetical protein JWQ14_1507, partial [Adhaeribacter sp.]|nr:hypothetical protein [Adhaeribacter sp.]